MESTIEAPFSLSKESIGEAPAIINMKAKSIKNIDVLIFTGAKLLIKCRIMHSFREFIVKNYILFKHFGPFHEACNAIMTKFLKTFCSLFHRALSFQM